MEDAIKVALTQLDHMSVNVTQDIFYLMMHAHV